uniref:Ig-like domain-containing protein n=1 Tax=Neogobius melanostomus TaxID=47308 RepID=A0A8C6S409_9GOBI
MGKELKDCAVNAVCLSMVVDQSGSQTGFFADPDSNITMDCRLSGYSMKSATMYWFRQKVNGAEIEMVTKEYDTSKGRFQSEFDKLSNTDTFLLQINKVIPDDTGIYYCAASHSREFNHITVQITVFIHEIYSVHKQLHYQPLSVIQENHKGLT